MITERINYIKSFYGLLSQQMLELKATHGGLEKIIKQLSEEILEMTELEKLVRLVSDYYSEQYISHLKEFVQNGLNEIFADKNYKFEIEIKDTKNQKEIQFLLHEGKLVTDLNNIGGGLKSIIGFLIQIFLLDKFGIKYLFLDECFSDVASEYVPNLFQFINMLIDKFGFNILLITHDDRIQPYIKKIYEVKDGKVNLIKDEH